MTTLKAKVDGAWVTVGGVGVGVPAGGATNAILTKASATDYATAWTTAPILTGLTLTGDASITGNATITGTLTSKHAVRAAAAVEGTDGSLINQFGFTSCARVSAGVYRLTLATAVTYPIAIATPLAAVGLTAVVQVESVTQFLVRIFSVGTATDGSFTVHVASP